MSSQIKKHSIALALAGVLGMAAPVANAIGIGGANFKFDESVVPDIVNPENGTANNFNFNYTARINQSNDGSNGGVLDGDAFTEAGFFNVGQYFLDANPVDNSLGVSNANGGYSIYGIFSLAGTATFNGSNGITATFTSGSLSIYLDEDKNTTKSISGAAVPPPLTTPTVTTANTADDQLIGSASLLTIGSANLFGGLANGDFEIIWGDWALTSFGSSYWYSPDPFHMTINFDGNTTQVNPPGSLTQPFSSLAIGSGNAFFSVPEPGSLALLGVGLLGFGASSWKRRRA